LYLNRTGRQCWGKGGRGRGGGSGWKGDMPVRNGQRFTAHLTRDERGQREMGGFRRFMRGGTEREGEGWRRGGGERDEEGGGGAERGGGWPEAHTIRGTHLVPPPHTPTLGHDKGGYQSEGLVGQGRYTCIHTYIQTYIHTYKHTYVHTYTHRYIHIHENIHVSHVIYI